MKTMPATSVSLSHSEDMQLSNISTGTYIDGKYVLNPCWGSSSAQKLKERSFQLWAGQSKLFKAPKRNIIQFINFYPSIGKCPQTCPEPHWEWLLNLGSSMYWSDVWIFSDSSEGMSNLILCSPCTRHVGRYFCLNLPVRRRKCC